MKRSAFILSMTGLLFCALAGTYYFAKQPSSDYQRAARSPSTNDWILGKEHNRKKEAEIPAQVRVPDNSQRKLEAELSKLKSELADLRLQVSAVRTPEEQVETIPEEKESLEDRELRQQQEAVKQLQIVTERFNRQQEITDWSIAAAERIELALNNKRSEGLNVDNVACKGAMCKLEISDLDEKGMDILQNKFRQQLGEIAASGMVGKDEYGKTVIFVAQQPEAIFGE